MANITVSVPETTVNVNVTNETVNVTTTISNVIAGETQVISVDETLVNNGNLSGNITLDLDAGRLHSGTLVGNITAISFVGLEAGRSATILLKQDAAGGNYLNTTTFPSAWSNWEFANNFKDLDINANEWNVISFFYDGSKIYASLIVEQTLAINNSDLANSNITVNGTTIALGGSGNIANFGNLTTTQLVEGTQLYFNTARARAALVAGTGISYNTTTGVISLADTGYISGVTAGSGLTGGGDTGNVTLNVGAGTGITVNADNVAVNMAAFTTTDLAEGTNLYFTAARARGNLSATTASGITYNSSTGVFSLASIPNSSLTNSAITINGTAVSLGGTRTLTTSDIAEGTNLYFTAARANSNVVSYIATVPLTVGGNLDVTGNINATGNINYQNVTDLYVTDQKITLNSNAATNANVEVIAFRPTATDTKLKWNEQATRWEFTNNGTTYYPIPTSTTDLAEGSNLWFTAARTNTAIDNYLIGGTGISYSSGTIALDFTEFSTTNIVEGSNLWFSNARVNSFIQDNITTTDIDEGTRLYYTTDRANTAIGAYQGSISTPGNISAGNVITTSIHSNGSSNITINSNTNLIVRETVKGVSTQVGNINGGGYAIFTGTGGAGTILSHSGAGQLVAAAFLTGNTTSGSNTITGVTLVDGVDLVTPLSLSNITQYFAWDYNIGLALSFPFPPGTYVQSVNAGAGTITMSQAAAATTDLNQSILLPQNIVPGLLPGAFDTNTGLLLGLLSTYSATGSGSKTTIAGQVIMTQGKYGYPATGPVASDFVYSVDTPSDYSATGLLDTDKLIARTQFEAPKTVMNFPRGLTVGDADLTNRAENDSLPSFGVNVLWDGLSPTTQYADGTPLTQLLIKNYTDNNLQSLNRTTFGPRLFFTASEGNKNQSYVTTYPRKNLELGRISWWSPAQNEPNLGTAGPPAWISAVTGQDNLTTNSGAGMFFGISPNTNNFNRSLFLASSMGNTVIASAQDSTGAHRPIIFAPSHIGSSQGNSALLYNQTIDGTDTITDTIQTSGAHFAQINFANTTALTGAKVSVTNGNNTNSTREGNIVLSIDRNLTTSNANVRVRTGGTNYNGSLNPDRVRFTFAPQGLVDGTAVIIRNFTNATLAGALNGNVFYVKRNDSAGYVGFDLYTDSGLTTPVNLGVGNVNGGAGTFEYARNNGVTAREWSFVLPQGSNDLLLTEDGVTTTTFASGGNVNVTGNINLTGRLLGYDRVYGEFAYTAGNIVPAAADTIYSFPLDTTLVNSDVIANNTSRINITKPGFYKLFTSIQIKNADNSADHIMRFWLRKNGADVANSATLITPLKLQEQVVSMHWMVESDGDDYWEIVYYVNNVNVTFPNYPAITSPVTAPAAPPIIVNVIPVGA
jgi:hypothetical protein